jgi:hypothetical protein
MDSYKSGIRPVVDDYLLAKADEVRDYGPYWSASSAGYCMRKLIFERLKLQSTLGKDPRRQRVFSAGHIFHGWLQELTRNAGISVAQEEELIDNNIMVKGHFDDLVLIDGKLILYDYKTVNSKAFTWAKATGNAMSHYHRMQLGTYMYMFRKPTVWLPKNDLLLMKERMTEGRILKISKDDLRMAEQVLPWTAALEKEVVGYWQTLNGYWQSQTLPQCTCADYENGFMAREKFNPYWYDGEPCSETYFKEQGGSKLWPTITP